MSAAPTRRFTLVAGIAAAACLTPRLGLAQAATVILGTATPGGGFPAYGAAVAKAVGAVDPELRIETRGTRGSTENVVLLQQGALDIALVTGEVAHEAMGGGTLPAAPTLSAVAAMYSSPGLFVVRADSPYRTIADLRGQPVAFGARGSGLVVLARAVLDGMGLDLDRDFHAITLDRAGDGPAMVLDGRAAALWGGGLAWPGFVAVASDPAGARFIAPGAEDIRAILAGNSALRPLPVPAGSYRGQEAPLATVGSWSLILARASLDEAVAYRLARTLHRAQRQLADEFRQASETTPANTVSAVAADMLHPGAARYLREAGFLR